MRIGLLLFGFLGFTLVSGLAQAPEIAHQVYFFGNLVDRPEPAFMDRLKQTLLQNENPFTLILNGDLTDEKFDSKAPEQQLDQLWEIMAWMEKSKKGQLLIIPGDRDWKNSQKGGQRQIEQLEKIVKKHLKSNNYKKTKWAIKEGCPGPKVIEKGEELAIVVLNTQWWNHPFDKPRSSDAVCGIITPEILKEELEKEGLLDRLVDALG